MHVCLSIHTCVCVFPYVHLLLRHESHQGVSQSMRLTSMLGMVVLMVFGVCHPHEGAHTHTPNSLSEPILNGLNIQLKLLSGIELKSGIHERTSDNKLVRACLILPRVCLFPNTLLHAYWRT